MRRIRASLFFAVLSGVLALCGSASAVAGLVSYWNFDEGIGTTAYDSANGNHGTIYGATRTGGIVGGALSFDGVDDYVDLGSDVCNNIRTINVMYCFFIQKGGVRC